MTTITEQYRTMRTAAGRAGTIAVSSLTMLLAFGPAAFAAPGDETTPAEPTTTTTVIEPYQLPSNCEGVKIISGDTGINKLIGAVIGFAPVTALITGVIAAVLFVVTAKSDKARPKMLQWIIWIMVGLFLINLVPLLIKLVTDSKCLA